MVWMQNNILNSWKCHCITHFSSF